MACRGGRRAIEGRSIFDFILFEFCFNLVCTCSLWMGEGVKRPNPHHRRISTAPLQSFDEASIKLHESYTKVTQRLLKSYMKVT